MKYTIEQKIRLKGMRSMIDLKMRIKREMGLYKKNFNIVGNYIVIASKLNRNKK
jgi:hypothetical protein